MGSSWIHSHTIPYNKSPEHRMESITGQSPRWHWISAGIRIVYIWKSIPSETLVLMVFHHPFFQLFHAKFGWISTWVKPPGWRRQSMPFTDDVHARVVSFKARVRLWLGWWFATNRRGTKIKENQGESQGKPMVAHFSWGLLNKQNGWGLHQRPWINSWVNWHRLMIRLVMFFQIDAKIWPKSDSYNLFFTHSLYIYFP